MGNLIHWRTAGLVLGSMFLGALLFAASTRTSYAQQRVSNPRWEINWVIGQEHLDDYCAKGWEPFQVDGGTGRNMITYVKRKK